MLNAELKAIETQIAAVQAQRDDVIAQIKAIDDELDAETPPTNTLELTRERAGVMARSRF